MARKTPNADGRERFLEKREAARNVDINNWVLGQAHSMQNTMIGYAPILNDPNCLVLRYEDMIFDKERSIDNMLHHFGWSLLEEEKDALLASVDIVPTVEDKMNFVRKAVPGDHKDKLSGDTIEELNRRLELCLKMFGYRT